MSLAQRAVRLAALSLVVGLAVVLLPVGAGAHVTSAGLAVLTVDGPTVTYRLTLVPAELPEPAAQLLAGAASGNRVEAERLAGAASRAVTLRVDGNACRPGRFAVQDAGTRGGE